MKNLELRLVPGQDAAKSKREFSHVWAGDSSFEAFFFHVFILLDAPEPQLHLPGQLLR